jgi:hypothetical protein
VLYFNDIGTNLFVRTWIFYAILSTSLINAGFYSGQMFGEVPEVAIHTLFDNFYVPLFFIVGLIPIVYGLLKK